MLVKASAHGSHTRSPTSQAISFPPSLPPTPLGKLRDEQQEAVIPEDTPKGVHGLLLERW